MYSPATERKSLSKNKYNFTIAAAPTEVSAAVIGEKVDFAAMPVNLASVLINKGADISLVAVNTLGVLYVLENGNEVTDIASLKGKTIYSTGAGATPQYVLEYILEKNGIDPKKDVTIEYLSEHAELAAKLAAGEVSIGVLPEPNVTSALINGKGNLRIALDITSEWDKVSTSKLAQGCIVVSNKFRREHPEAYKAVVSELAASVEYVNANGEEASKLIEKYGIIPKAALAKKALPNCNICFITGDDANKCMQDMLAVLFEANPASVGGKLPADSFYGK